MVDYLGSRYSNPGRMADAYMVLKEIEESLALQAAFTGPSRKVPVSELRDSERLFYDDNLGFLLYLENSSEL